MSASQHRRARGYAHARILIASILSTSCIQAFAGDAVNTAECDVLAVDTHVREQFSIYGPRSGKAEYFGFIYRANGIVASAIVQGRVCRGHDDCMVDTKPAARLIPKGAKVLGEWHTHPHFLGSSRLSIEDVRGARANAHIHCYSAYYAGAYGEIYSWDPASTSVPEAMGRRIELGNYRRNPPAVSSMVVAGN